MPGIGFAFDPGAIAMQKPLEQFARLGIVHHMLYPECMTDPDDHVRTLTQFMQRDDIETFDCCLPYGEHRQKPLIEAIRKCGKQDIVFATHLYPARKISFASPLSQEQAQARMIVEDLLSRLRPSAQRDLSSRPAVRHLPRRPKQTMPHSATFLNGFVRCLHRMA